MTIGRSDRVIVLGERLQLFQRRGGDGISSLRVRLCCLDASLMAVRVAPFSGGNCITTKE
jgi:hypothetical protein